MNPAGAPKCRFTLILSWPPVECHLQRWACWSQWACGCLRRSTGDCADARCFHPVRHSESRMQICLQTSFLHIWTHTTVSVLTSTASCPSGSITVRFSSRGALFPSVPFPSWLASEPSGAMSSFCTALGSCSKLYEAKTRVRKENANGSFRHLSVLFYHCFPQPGSPWRKCLQVVLTNKKPLSNEMMLSAECNSEQFLEHLSVGFVAIS